MNKLFLFVNYENKNLLIYDNFFINICVMSRLNKVLINPLYVSINISFEIYTEL